MAFAGGIQRGVKPPHPRGRLCCAVDVMFLVAHELCLFGDMLPGIIFVAIEMSIFCGVDFFYHPCRLAGTRGHRVHGGLRGGELMYYFNSFFKCSEIIHQSVSPAGSFW